MTPFEPGSLDGRDLHFSIELVDVKALKGKDVMEIGGSFVIDGGGDFHDAQVALLGALDWLVVPPPCRKFTTVPVEVFSHFEIKMAKLLESAKFPDAAQTGPAGAHVSPRASRQKGKKFRMTPALKEMSLLAHFSPENTQAGDANSAVILSQRHGQHGRRHPR